MNHSNAESQKERFISQIAPNSAFYALFDHLPGVSFFAKNDSFEIVCASHSFLERLGCIGEEEIQGLTDYDLFPRSLANNFRLDDEWVIHHKKPRTNIVELFLNEGGLPDWYLTNKLPIHNQQGDVIGVMGTTQSYQHGKEFTAPYFEIEPAIEYIQQQFRNRISISQVAEHIGISLRQLDRKFQKLMRMSPQTFITRLRLKNACSELRQSNKLILEIALDLGFYDQSSFTLHFRKHMGTTPLRYRKEHRNDTFCDQNGRSEPAELPITQRPAVTA
jgi:AraC-like DNA-binding protein